MRSSRFDHNQGKYFYIFIHDTFQEDTTSKPQLDLAFKEGQTIKVNINIPKSEKTKARSKGGATGMLLPPPPGGIGVKPPPSHDNNNTVS